MCLLIQRRHHDTDGSILVLQCAGEFIAVDDASCASPSRGLHAKNGCYLRQQVKKVKNVQFGVMDPDLLVSFMLACGRTRRQSAACSPSYRRGS